MAVDVLFPKTNPIIFGRESDYEPYHDSLLHETERKFCQQFADTDLISFQFNHIGKTIGFSVEIVVNGVEYTLMDILYTGGNMPENMTESNFGGSYIRKNNNGLYYFSRRVCEIRIDREVGGMWIEGERLIYDGDDFYFKIYTDGVNSNSIFYSNKLVCKNDTTKTKLIHYTQLDTGTDPVFGTRFDLMTKGYDIRLQAEFLPLNQKAGKEIFQVYDGGFDLVSSLPYETVKLQIGMENGAGLPDWLLRNLNYIFHLNDKTIDGVRYELVEGAELETEIVQGYNPRMVSIELAKKDVEDWKNTYLATVHNPTIPSGIFVRYNDLRNYTTGVLTIVGADRFYLDSLNASFFRYNFSQLSGIGTVEIQFSTTINTTDKDIITEINIVDRATNIVVGKAKLELPVVRTGVCNWEICDTFFVRC